MHLISGKFKWSAVAALAVCLLLAVWAGVEVIQEQVLEASADFTMEEAIDPITGFKTLRQQIRAMEKAQLNDVIHNPDTDPEIIAMAQRQLLALCEREEQELTLEGVLSMRGYENPVVTVHNDSVNVLILAELITQQESSIIMELVCRETGVQSGNVKIIPIN